MHGPVMFLATRGAEGAQERKAIIQEFNMSKTSQFRLALVALILLTGAVCFAQSGETTYKAKCQMCHGATGMADTGAGKAMKVKPITAPDVKSFSEQRMIEAVRDGMGKMQPYKGKLTDTQIKEAVSYFRTFLKK